MKNGIIWLGQVIGFAIILSLAPSARAQTPVTVVELIGSVLGPPEVLSFGFTNVGGVVYFDYKLSGEGTLAVGPAINYPNITRQSFTLNSPEISIPESVVNIFQGVAVLGTIPPGTYYYAMDYTPLFNDGNLTPNFLQFKLDVPTNTTPTLSSVGIENNLFHFTVNGVSGVRYTVQSSDNLTNWTSVATNSGAPFIFVEPRDQSITNRFYRTLIESEAVKVN